MRAGLKEIREAMDARKVTPEVRERIEKQLGERERLMPEICSPQREQSGPTHDLLQKSLEGDPQTNAPKISERGAPSLTIFHDGHVVTVGHGHQQSGVIRNYGQTVGIQHDNSAETGLTMYSRKELLEQTPYEHRAALHSALRDGNRLDISVGHKGVAVHDKSPALEGNSQAPTRQRAQERTGGYGLGL